MPLVLYATTCYIKGDHYRLFIEVDNSDSKTNDNKSTEDSSEFKSVNISIDDILPSSTRICFEPLNEKKNITVPKHIVLNRLLNVQQIKSILNKFRRTISENNDSRSRTATLTPTDEKSNTFTSETPVRETLPVNRPNGLGRFFSQPRLEPEKSSTCKTIIKISYVDVSNSIRWRVKYLTFELETEDLANEAYVNLRLCLSTLKQRPRKLLAFVNPFGGKGNRENTFWN